MHTQTWRKPFQTSLEMSELIGNLFIGNGDVLPAAEYPRFKKLSDIHPSVYEVIRVEDGIPLFFADYMDRLTNSFAMLRQDLPLSREQIAEMVALLVRITGHRSGPVKLVFGTGDDPFFMMFLMKPHLPLPVEYLTGVKTVLMRETRSNPNLKIWNKGLRDRSVALLEKTGSYETILVNAGGFITEASRSNVFFVKENEVFTTGEALILPGITRKKVLEVCREQGIRVHLTTIPASGIEVYDSCFLTGTARKIVPVRLVDDVPFKVDTAMLKAIAGHFEDYVQHYIQSA